MDAPRLEPPHVVKWKDILSGLWKDPDPVLTQARGAICVLPQDAEDPIWVPERLNTQGASSGLQHSTCRPASCCGS